jgi:nucleoside-diphosphate-sugar epimerase
MASKPRVLVLGGLGFIGKHLVKYLVANNVASKIRVCDKIMVQMARLGKEFTDCFSSVECVQANLTDPDSVARAFKDSEGDYSIVINLAGETKLSQSDEVYAQGVTKLSVNCIHEAAKHKTAKFIEVSTAEVYDPSDNAATEDSTVKPWTGIAKAKLKVEEELKATKGMPWIIVRPAIVYGKGDVRGLSPRLCIAAVYKKTGEKMEFPQWFEQQKINAVHVKDVVKALWHLAMNGAPNSVYNLAAKDNLDTKKLNVFLEKLFGIKTGPLGTIKSEAVKMMSMEAILDEINGETLPHWLKLVKESKLDYSPLSPYLELEQISNKNLCVDGSKIEKSGFSYDYPAVTGEELNAQLAHATAEGWFPKI